MWHHRDRGRRVGGQLLGVHLLQQPRKIRSLLLKTKMKYEYLQVRGNRQKFFGLKLRYIAATLEAIKVAFMSISFFY